jgi:hypothetical protein
MSLWGNDIKPKNLTDAEKKEVFANTKGWVREAGSILSGNGNTSADPEVLVAIGGLSANMGSANITELEFITTAFDKSDGGTLSVRARFNEPVTVTGTPQLTVVNDSRANHTLSYASGSTTNELVFSLVIGAANAATNAGDELSLGANAMSLNGGTIKDTGQSGTNATITNAASIGTAAGTITVTA